MTFSHALKLWGRQRFFHNRAKIEEMEKRFSRSESLSGRSFRERAVTLRPVALRWDEFVKYEKLLIFGAQKFSPKPEIGPRCCSTSLSSMAKLQPMVNVTPDNIQLLQKRKCHCCADLMFYRFWFNQTGKLVDNFHIKHLNQNQLNWRWVIQR